MSFHKLSAFFRFPSSFRQYATKTKVEIDPAVVMFVKRVDFRQHPGQLHPRTTLRIPQDIEEAITTILQDQNQTALIQNGMAFVRHLHGRHAPLEEKEKALLVKAEEFKVEQKLLKKQPHLDPEQYAKSVSKGVTTAKQRVKVKENLWKQILYDDQKCFQYLLLRGPADYAVLKVVLTEIAKRDPDFQPQSLLDFGSGVGTVSWVVEKLWKTCKEFYNIDICSSMRELAGLVLKRGNPQVQLSPSIFFKGFLPTSLNYTHDIVVSAYSLFELPGRQQRLETLLTLWNKTNSYLVIVEEGTSAGYKLVIEARDFILEMAEREQEVAGGSGAHVFAPCAHDRACPRFLTSKYPCNFEVLYMQHQTVPNSEPVKERYSYVVLKRGARDSPKTAWPRVIEPIKARSKHGIVRLCTADGELNQLILSKAKNADGSYKLLTKSEWGDTLPFILTKYEDDQLNYKQRQRLQMLENKKRKEEQGNVEQDVKEEENSNS